MEPGPAKADTSSVRCPQCGASSPLPAGERLFQCSYCDAALFVDRAAGAVQHYFLPRRLDAEHGAAALRRWMAGNDTVKDLDRKASIAGLEAVSFPVWLFRSRQAEGETVFVEPAAPTPIPQLADLRVPAGRLEPFREASDLASSERVEPTIPVETARGWLDQRGVSGVTETALVDVPLWRAAYSFEGDSFQALVEASTGQVLAAVFPEKAESPYVGVALLGLLVFGILGLAISDPGAKLAAYLVAALPLWLLAWWVTRKV
jgi:hypothetical protein